MAYLPDKSFSAEEERKAWGKDCNALASAKTKKVVSIAKKVPGGQKVEWFFSETSRLAAAYMLLQGAPGSLEALTSNLSGSGSGEGAKRVKEAAALAKTATPGTDAACRSVADGEWRVENARRDDAIPLERSAQFSQDKIDAFIAPYIQRSSRLYFERKRGRGPEAC